MSKTPEGTLVSYFFSLFVVAAVVTCIMGTLLVEKDFTVKYTVRLKNRVYSNCTFRENQYYDKSGKLIEFGDEVPVVSERDKIE